MQVRIGIASEDARDRLPNHQIQRARPRNRSTMSTHPGEQSVTALEKGLEVDCLHRRRYFPITTSRYSRRVPAAPHGAPTVWERNAEVGVSRNSLIPIKKLPSEVFSGIFEYRGSDRVLIAATHIYHRWRSTLTSTPSLWTNLDCCRLLHTSSNPKRHLSIFG